MALVDARVGLELDRWNPQRQHVVYLYRVKDRKYITTIDNLTREEAEDIVYNFQRRKEADKTQKNKR